MNQNSRQYLLLTFFVLLLSLAVYGLSNWLKPSPKPATTQIPTGVSRQPANNTPAPTSNIQKPTSNIQELTPTPAFKTFTSPTDNFSVTYSSSRKLYQDTESDKINRYTFYRNDSNFAIHVGREAWSWEHPSRDFSGNFLVSGQNTFRFNTTGQTIVDIDKNGLKYTIQCIHHNLPSAITECDSFLKSFKLN